MPVRAKTSSEYVKKFRWNDSIKSASFTPTKEQNAPQAGMSSVDYADSFAITREPPLQRRRKPLQVDNKMTYTTKQFMTTPDSEDSSDIGKPNKIPGSSLSKTFLKKVDMPTITRPPIDKNLKTEKNKAIAANTRVISRPSQPPPPTKKVAPPSPTKTEKGPAFTKSDKHVPKAGGDASKTKSKAEQETDEALQYRAGIRARPGGPKYSSEYQRQFDWKQPSKESPLMAAEQMVHNSNANLAPYIPDKIHRHTEYQRQYKQQNHAGPLAQEQLMQNAQQEIKAKYRVKTKSKRAKKLTPDKHHPAGVPSVISHDDPRLVKSSQNPQRPFFPHATTRKWRSEYKSNFKTPEVFSYENGVWKGADPPHIQPRDDSSDRGAPKPEQLTRSKSVGDLPNWFSEVLELRERARDYQKRSRGTHFSREHLAQLLASQARLWEESSDQRSISSSISTQTSGSEKKDKPKEEPRPSTSAPGLGHEPTRRKLAWHANNNKAAEEPNQNIHTAPLDRRSSISSVTTPEPVPSTSSMSSDIESIEENGRLPTPTLVESEPSHGTKRHHLDRTTPAKGGALLTSPASRRRAHHVPKPTTTFPRQGEHMKPSSRTYVARSAPARAIIPGGITKGFEYDSDDDDDVDLDRTLTQGQQTPPRNPTQQKQLGRFLQTSPLAGRRTSDPHPLNDELISPGFQRHSERFYETSPGMPTIPSKIEPPKTWAAPRAGLKTAPHAGKGPLERPHSGSIAGRPQTAVPQTRDAASQQVQRLNSFMSPRSNGPESPDDWDLTPPRGGGRGRRDSDELSLSTMSNASSSTLASEVLERAKKRRDEFWGKEKRD
ncbi:nuclear protein MDM1-like [Lytechinus pictus]|uniref:nuclear protein MDM1-like n=1 Tax=Lytechinus pictus TaxID=7653 RepID=UPI0030BA2946